SPSMPATLTHKILEAHRVSGSLAAGQELALEVDQVLLQDATGTMAALQFLELGVERVKVPLAVQYVDHNLLQLDQKNPDDHVFLESFCARHGIHFSRLGT